jgi:small subunit ribosomal protein S9
MNNDSRLPGTKTAPTLSPDALSAGPAAEAPAKPPRQPKPADKHGWWWGTGRRKTAVARVRIRPAKEGEGKIEVLSHGRRIKGLEQYFSEERDRADVLLPFRLTNNAGKFDLWIRVQGGGTMGQAQAVRLGVARALVSIDPSVDKVLRDNGLLTRDSREVERKKYGQAGARRRFQFSKR